MSFEKDPYLSEESMSTLMLHISYRSPLGMDVKHLKCPYDYYILVLLGTKRLTWLRIDDRSIYYVCTTKHLSAKKTTSLSYAQFPVGGHRILGIKKKCTSRAGSRQVFH